MGKREQIMELVSKIEEIQEEKIVVTKEQRYEDAADLRDKEKELMKQLDELTNLKDCYKLIYRSEKILFHLENITTSTEELKKLDNSFEKILENLEYDKYLLKLYRERDKAFVSLLQLRDFMSKEEKKV